MAEFVKIGLEPGMLRPPAPHTHLSNCLGVSLASCSCCHCPSVSLLSHGQASLASPDPAMPSTAAQGFADCLSFSGAFDPEM